jgi:hypothetical protein
MDVMRFGFFGIAKNRAWLNLYANPIFFLDPHFFAGACRAGTAASDP